MVDRKLDLLNGELERNWVSVVWSLGSRRVRCVVSRGWVYFITPLPSDCARSYKNEGVNIAMATEAWRNAGEMWEAVSSRLVVARLK